MLASVGFLEGSPELILHTVLHTTSMLKVIRSTLETPNVPQSQWLCRSAGSGPECNLLPSLAPEMRQVSFTFMPRPERVCSWPVFMLAHRADAGSQGWVFGADVLCLHAPLSTHEERSWDLLHKAAALLSTSLKSGLFPC